MGDWAVIEYERSSGRRIRTWNFPSLREAQQFRAKREEFYRIIRLKKRVFSAPLPMISKAEMELFERIIENPQWMALITHELVG